MMPAQTPGKPWRQQIFVAGTVASRNSFFKKPFEYETSFFYSFGSRLVPGVGCISEPFHFADIDEQNNKQVGGVYKRAREYMMIWSWFGIMVPLCAQLLEMRS